MDKLLLRHLECYAAIGVTPAEREVGQRLLINVELSYDLRAAGQSDELTDTISYSNVARTIQKVATTLECQLLEYLAEQLCAAILDEYPVQAVRLQLFKKPPPVALTLAMAGVEIVRQRSA